MNKMSYNHGTYTMMINPAMILFPAQESQCYSNQTHTHNSEGAGIRLKVIQGGQLVSTVSSFTTGIKV